jgi:hypothetical protein
MAAVSNKLTTKWSIQDQLTFPADRSGTPVDVSSLVLLVLKMLAVGA